jgi:hypothetical protein
MANLGKIHVGDVNTDLILTVQKTVSGVNSVYDISTGVDTLEIIIADPDGNETTFTASLVGDGTDGKIHYINTSAATFDESGAWTAKGKVTRTDLSVFTSNPVTFEVLG